MGNSIRRSRPPLVLFRFIYPTTFTSIYGPWQAMGRFTASLPCQFLHVFLLLGPCSSPTAFGTFVLIVLDLSLAVGLLGFTFTDILSQSIDQLVLKPPFEELGTAHVHREKDVRGIAVRGYGNDSPSVLNLPAAHANPFARLTAKWSRCPNTHGCIVSSPNQPCNSTLCLSFTNY